MQMSPGLSDPDEPDLMLDINTTPLIDVMLVLLVMLIITIPVQLHALNMQLPVGVPPAQRVQPDKVQIDIDPAGLVRWQSEVVDAAELARRMGAIARMAVQPEVYVQPHRDAGYAVFAQVLAASRRSGLTRVAVIGSEQFR